LLGCLTACDLKKGVRCARPSHEPLHNALAQQLLQIAAPSKLAACAYVVNTVPGGTANAFTTRCVVQHSHLPSVPACDLIQQARRLHFYHTPCMPPQARPTPHKSPSRPGAVVMGSASLLEVLDACRCVPAFHGEAYLQRAR